MCGVGWLNVENRGAEALVICFTMYKIKLLSFEIYCTLTLIP